MKGRSSSFLSLFCCASCDNLYIIKLERKKDKTIKLQTDVQLSNRTVGCLYLNKQTTRSRQGTSQGEFLGADNEDLPVNNGSNTL